MKNAIELYAENGITLYDVNGVVYTTTESVAKKFGKDKRDVNKKLKSFPDFDELIACGKIAHTEISAFDRANSIEAITYIDRDTMTLLIMGFTGNKAYEWKKQYIRAFNLMEEKLTKPQPIIPFKEKKLNALADIAQKLGEVADEIMKLEDDIPKITTEETDLINTRKVRASYTKQTKHQYYRLKVTPLNQLSKLIASPTTGKVVFEYYNKNTSIICLKANDFKAQKIPTPAWLKS